MEPIGNKPFDDFVSVTNWGIEDFLDFFTDEVRKQLDLAFLVSILKSVRFEIGFTCLEYFISNFCRGHHPVLFVFPTPDEEVDWLLLEFITILCNPEIEALFTFSILL